MHHALTRRLLHGRTISVRRDIHYVSLVKTEFGHNNFLWRWWDQLNTEENFVRVYNCVANISNPNIIYIYIYQ